jgi:hypothetical protein
MKESSFWWKGPLYKLFDHLYNPMENKFYKQIYIQTDEHTSRRAAFLKQQTDFTKTYVYEPKFYMVLHI